MAVNTTTPAQVAPPPLPQSTPEYSRQWQDQYSNVLRLFFNRLDSIINSLLSINSGGSALFFPHATNYSDVTQIAALANTAYEVSFPTQFGSAVPIGIFINDTIAKVTFPGVSEIEVILQYRSSTSTSKDVTVWLRIDDVDVPYSAQRTNNKGNGYGQVSFVTHINMTGDQEIKIMWATTDTNLVLESLAPSAPYPGIPSAILNIEHASNVEL